MKKISYIFVLMAITLASLTIFQTSIVKAEQQPPSSCLYLYRTYEDFSDQWVAGQCFRLVTPPDWWVCEGYTTTCFGGEEVCSDYNCKIVFGCKEVVP